MPRLRKIQVDAVTSPSRRVVGYARVSTRRQAEHALSLHEQQRRIEAYCVTRNLDLAEFFVDAGLSGTTAKRPQFQAMLEYVKERRNGVAGVVIYNSSRLFRNAREFLIHEQIFKDSGVRLMTTEQEWPEGADGELMRTVAVAVDQHASRRISETTQDMMLANAENGYWNGSVAPFGYKVETALIVGKKTTQTPCDRRDGGICHASGLRLVPRSRKRRRAHWNQENRAEIE
jgi:site-specific DNA recombinase